MTGIGDVLRNILVVGTFAELVQEDTSQVQRDMCLHRTAGRVRKRA